MTKYAGFHELIAWQRGMDLAEDVHRSTSALPIEDRPDLGRQLRRASASIPSNVAEGFGSHSRARYRRHVAIALGSNAEVQTQLELTRRLALLNIDVIQRLVARAAEVGRLLYGLWRALGPAAVCYSVFLVLVTFGLRPLALGLAHGSFLP